MANAEDCQPPCWWIEDGLCSTCVVKGIKPRTREGLERAKELVGEDEKGRVRRL
jgi:hypothetical protein